jgi:myxalamid-type polyketide synthase MxaB
MNAKLRNEPIAVIGMACRFPGGANPGEFWEFLMRGGDAVSEVPHDRWDVAALYDPDPNVPGRMYTKSGAFLPDFDHFSPAFFGISPREAQFMDPQQRLLLEVSWEALENAAVVPERLTEKQVGIFVGIGTTDYGDAQVPLGALAVDAYNGTGGSHAAAAGRLSYFLGVRGPSLAVDTACSSSLVTAHLAMMSLRSGESDLALASGVNLNFSAEVFISLCKARMLSPDGRCKAFDASANGYVRGEGCGVVVLKRLSDALADGDHIHALLRGSAVNHNGRSSGLTVPSGPAQQEVIRTALRNAGIEPSEIGYLEAHGTGTAVGDPIEAGALGAVFAGRETPLLIGSVKTNCGHLEWAAGVCGLVKVILSMQHAVIPASLHYKEPNPLIKWGQAPFRVVTEPTPWPGEHRIAGVSSFGFGGTNAHVVVEEAPRSGVVPPPVDRPLHLLSLRAKSEKSLRELAGRVAAAVEGLPAAALPDVCFTANVGRSRFEHRLSVRVAAKSDLVAGLSCFAANQPSADVRSARASDSSGDLAMLFTGQGSQRPGMGRELYATQPTFRRELDRCAEILRPLLDRPLLDILHPEGVAPNDAMALIHNTAFTQPALFALEYALAALWRSWGIVPDVVLGHSVGEYAAACVANVFDVEDGLRLIAARGRLMQALPRNGVMVAIHAGDDVVSPVLAPYLDRVSLAAINGPHDVVLSGEEAAVETIVAKLKADGIAAQRLVVSHAFHSPLMDPMLEEFRRVAETVQFRPPNLTLISNVTATAAGAEISDPAYWVGHVRAPVRFADSVRAAAAEGCSRFLEVGPQPVLCGLGQLNLEDDKLAWLPSLHAKRGEWRQMLESLAALELQGVDVDWDGFDRDYPRAKLALPTYPFERQRYWFPAVAGGRVQTTGALLPLVDSIARSPLVKETILTVSLGVPSHPYLADHKVYDQVIVPGAAYLAFLASGAELIGWPSCRISEMYFVAPLALAEGAGRTIQAVLFPEEAGGDNAGGGFTFQIVVPPSVEEGDETLRLAVGKIEPLSTPAIFSVDLADLQRRCTVGVEPEQLFEAASAAGVELGPSFRWVDHVWRGKREALAQLSVPEEIGDLAGYRIHPALLDTCFQIAGATLMDEPVSETLLPFCIKSIEIMQSVRGTGWWCHAARTGDTTWDIRLFDAAGAVVAALDGFEMRKAPVDRFTRRQMADWFYRTNWDAQPLTVLPNAAVSGTWFVFSNGSELGSALGQRLADRGEHCVMVAEGDAFDGALLDFAPPAIERAVINPSEQRDIGLLIERCAQLGLPPCRGFIHLWSLKRDPSDSARAECAQDLAIGFLHLAQAAVPPNRLLVVTSGAQPVLPGEDADPTQAPLWGMIRTLSLEAPALHASGLDLDPAPTRQQVDAILAEIDSAPGEPQIAYRGNERFVARLVRYREAIVSPLEGPFRLQLAEYGSPDQLRLVPMTRRKPGPEEVEIAVRAAALNFRDVLITLGMLRDFYEQDLGIARASDIHLGFDCAGTITAVGERITDLAVGDEVMAAAAGGTASHVTIYRECVTRVPSGFDFATAAAIPNVFLTAYHALVRLTKLKSGESVLIHAAAGGVGLAAVQIAQAAGAVVFATASPGKWDYLKSQGVTHILNSRTLDFADEIMRATDGAGVDVVLNSLGGAAIDKSFSVLKPGGRFVELGKLGIWTPEMAASRRPDAAYYTFELGAALDHEPAAFQAYGEEIKRKLEAGIFHPLPKTTFSIADASEAYRFMQQAKHVGKVVLTLEDAEPTAISPDASYLITGGLGGLGLKVAERLVAAGARHLVLSGRSEPRPAVGRGIDAMRLAGASVSVVRGDVARAKDVAAMIEACQALAPLKGIVHAAGIIQDGMLRNQTAAHFKSVMAPKVIGAWQLHQQSRALALDFFICFSSMASLIGSAGQANYAAANAYLDALAHRRRANGLPALSINWGPWAEVGMAAAIDVTGLEVEKFDAASGIDVFTALLQMRQRSAPVQVGAFKMRWKTFLQRWAAIDVPIYFSSLVGARRQAEPSRDEFINTLRAAPAKAREGLLTAHIHEVLRQVLGLAQSEVIEDVKPWADLGLDSLMMVEVKNRLERSLRVALPVEILMQEVSIQSVAAFLLEKIGDSVVAEHLPAQPKGLGDEEAVRLEILERYRDIPQAFTTVDAQRRRKVLIDGRWRVDLASCNYLGFDLEPEIMAAIPPAVEEWGVHPSWTRAVASPALYAKLEQELADTVGAAQTLVFPSISLLHLGVLPALAGVNGVILKDAESHHSIHEACQRAQGEGVEWLEFRHNDVEDLERRLAKIRLDRPKIIATDGAYSMGSANPPLKEYARLAETYNATVYVDDAHGFGIYGADPDDALPYGHGGNGIVRHLDLDYDRDRIVYVAGLSKAFSSYAAFVTCQDERTKLWLQSSGPYVFSGPTSVASLATALAGLRLNRRDGDVRRVHIHRLTRRLVAEARRIGFEVDNDSNFPIVGVVIGGWDAMITACGILWQNDILITPATFPAVPVNRNLVRFSLTSANTEEELDQAIRALQAVWNALHPGEGAAQSREVAAVLSS